MPKRTHADPRQARQRRDAALARGELRIATDARVPSAGVTSRAVKRGDPAVRAAIDEFLARRATPSQNPDGRHKG
jgi:hypothetical protein